MITIPKNYLYEGACGTYKVKQPIILLPRHNSEKEIEYVVRDFEENINGVKPKTIILGSVEQRVIDTCLGLLEESFICESKFKYYSSNIQDFLEQMN